MKIHTLFNPHKPALSLEFFPPKTPEGERLLFAALNELRPLKPSFVSVTHGAGGSERSKTLDWAKKIQEQAGLTAMAHLTCVGHGKDQLEAMLSELQQAGIVNIMAIRGDAPKNSAGWQPASDGFRYAAELVAFIRQRFGDAFCLAGGGYPEGHPENPSQSDDLLRLKDKVDAGLDVIVTQLFFNNASYFGFVERARRIGINVPIVPGLMPITNLSQIRRFMDMCGASIPGPLLSRLERSGDVESVLQVGVEHTLRQAQELLEAGVPGIHFYTLNKSPATLRVIQQLNLTSLASRQAVGNNGGV